MRQTIEKITQFAKGAQIHVGVGQSTLVESYQAGQEAIAEALDKHPGTPDVLIVFGSTRFKHKQLLEGIVSIVGEIPIVGGTTAGEISTNGFSTQSVVLMALSSDNLRFTTGIGKHMSQDEAACNIETWISLPAPVSASLAKARQTLA